MTHTMLEAKCKRCGETFVPADKKDLKHGVTENGKPCGGKGKITRVYKFSQSY